MTAKPRRKQQTQNGVDLLLSEANSPLALRKFGWWRAKRYGLVDKFWNARQAENRHAKSPDLRPRLLGQYPGALATRDTAPRRLARVGGC